MKSIAFLSVIALVALTTHSVSCASEHDPPSTRDMLESERRFMYDGTELKRMLDLASSLESLSPSENIDGHHALAYVMGVADTIDGTDACPSLDARSFLLFETVRRYIAHHPEKLSGSASGIVKDALSEAFPCPQQHTGGP